MKRTAHLRLAIGILTATAATSCFTGIESTPRIGDSDVRRNNAAGTSSEQVFLSGVVPAKPSEWIPGRSLWRVDDDRFSRVLAPGSGTADSYTGRTLAYTSRGAASSLTGADATDILLTDIADGRQFTVRVPVPTAAMDTVTRIEIPFAVELSLAARTDSLLRGRELFLLTADWFDGRGVDVAGLRYVSARVDSVVPGTYIYPAAGYFTLGDARQAARAGIRPGDKRMVLMSVGGTGAPTRSFDRLFTFTDPHSRYPQIEDEVWELITAGKIRAGMSRDECRLALGGPNSIDRYPTRGGMKEIWNYSDGVYLLFDDGFLTAFRQ